MADLRCRLSMNRSNPWNYIWMPCYTRYTLLTSKERLRIRDLSQWRSYFSVNIQSAIHVNRERTPPFVGTSSRIHLLTRIFVGLIAVDVVFVVRIIPRASLRCPRKLNALCQLSKEEGALPKHQSLVYQPVSRISKQTSAVQGRSTMLAECNRSLTLWTGNSGAITKASWILLTMRRPSLENRARWISMMTSSPTSRCVLIN